MQATIVIALWNGASVVSDCLDAIYAHSGDELLEVICVDNASRDESAALVADSYPQVRLIRQPVNLGFAGGVNAGIGVARGDVFVLLNQDCVVQPGWLAALLRAFEVCPECGIAGCTILDPDGAVNHAGAMIRRPDAYGVHLTEIGDNQPRIVEYVTGTVFAVRRQTWDAVGRFDEGYYPAYYEESDYCFRARHRGFETAYAPEARAVHLFSIREWQAEPAKHTANQHRARYRFVCKHFDTREIGEFLEAENAAVEAERYFDQAVGRVMAARDTLRALTDILERRRADLEDPLSPTFRCQLQVGFTQILRRSFAVSEKLSPAGPDWGPSNLAGEWEAAKHRLRTLQRREHDLLTRIYFKPPSADRSEPTLGRFFRLLVLRPLSFFIGRDYLLLSELNTVHVARMDQLRHQMDLVERMYREMERRLRLLEVLTDYDYR
jgi:GT2 family glycosyltransferase